MNHESKHLFILYMTTGGENFVRTGIVILARMGSSRLPGKHMMRINKKTIMEILIDRIKHKFPTTQIIIATSDKPENKSFDRFNNICTVFHGDNGNIPLRIKQCVDQYNLDKIICFGGDNPLTSLQATKLVEEGLDKADYVETVGLPIGMNVFGFTKNCVDISMTHEASSKKDIEFSWNLIFKNGITKNINYHLKFESDLRITMDYPKDFYFFVKVFRHFGERIYSISDLELINEITKLNFHLINCQLTQEYWERFNIGTSKTHIKPKAKLNLKKKDGNEERQKEVNDLICLRDFSQIRKIIKIRVDFPVFFPFMKSMDLLCGPKIALVGNSRSLLDFNFGSKIDSYDDVIRFNWAITNKFEKYVGSKETIRVAAGVCLKGQKNIKHPKGLVNDYNIFQKFKHLNMIIYDNKIKLDRPNLTKTAKKYKVDTKTNKFYGMTWKKNFFDKILTALAVPIKLTRPPQVGLGTALLCCSAGLVPDLYGFDIKKSDYNYGYYWSKVKHQKLSPHHDISIEHKILIHLNKTNKINLF